MLLVGLAFDDRGLDDTDDLVKVRYLVGGVSAVDA